MLFLLLGGRDYAISAAFYEETINYENLDYISEFCIIFSLGWYMVYTVMRKKIVFLIKIIDLKF